MEVGLFRETVEHADAECWTGIFMSTDTFGSGATQAAGRDLIIEVKTLSRPSRPPRFPAVAEGLAPGMWSGGAFG